MVMTPSFYLHVHVTGESNESQEYSLTPEEKKRVYSPIICCRNHVLIIYQLNTIQWPSEEDKDKVWIKQYWFTSWSVHLLNFINFNDMLL